MLVSYENLLSSSFLLYLNNRVLTLGSGFYNTQSLFYQVPQIYANTYTYSAPFKPLVSDISVPGATVLTGVYLNNNFITIGQSGLTGIDYDNGALHFSSQLPKNSILSGNYSFNELSINMASFSDPTVLFETKLQLRPKQPQVPTGLTPNQLTYPTIFIKNEMGENKPWAFGGAKMTKSEVNAYIFAESQFQLDAIVSNFKDAYYEYVPFLTSNEMPFNNMGGFKNNIPYNYTGIVGNRIANNGGVLIESIAVTDWGRRGLAADIEKLTTEAFFSLATFTLSRERLTK